MTAGTAGPLVLVAGGGTGGHVYPALAAARALAARGARVELVGTGRGIETRLVPAAGFPLHLLPVRGLVGKGPLDLARGLGLLPLGLLRAALLVARLRPAAVLGVGGYASGPTVAAAWLGRVPIALHEQNVVPGQTNRWLARLARVVAVSFAASSRAFPGQVVVTGNPVRAELFAAPPVAAGDRLRLLLFGGSQGSRVLNRAMTGALGALAGQAIEVVHQTGPHDLDEVRAAYAGSAFAAARVVPFLDDMPAVLAWANLVVSRAGATTTAELAAAGRAAIMVPLEAAGGHQEANARALVEAGGAELLLQRDLTPERLAERVRALAAEPGRLVEMGRQARTLARPDAARDLAELVLGLVRRPGQGGAAAGAGPASTR